MACSGCGGKRRVSDRRTSPPAERRGVDPTQGFFAATVPQYEVVRHGGESRGKRFSTLMAAEEYARKIRGIIRPV